MKDQKRSVTVEDLLQLKRGERPPEAFWAEFDRQLRAKQLAALVGKRPWWQRMRGLVPSWSRYHLPIGVTAAMAVTFFALREPSESSATLVQATAAGSAPIASVSSHPQNAAAAAFAVVADAPLHHPTLAADRPAEATSSDIRLAGARPTTVLRGAVDEFTPETITRNLPLLGTDSAEETPSPSARFIAANLAAAQDSLAPALFSEGRGFESRAMPARSAAVEPLQQIALPGESRRTNRFLTAMVAMPVTDTTVRSAERMANRISVDELYDQPHRFGTRRGGVNMKF